MPPGSSMTAISARPAFTYGAARLLDQRTGAALFALGPLTDALEAFRDMPMVTRYDHQRRANWTLIGSAPHDPDPGYLDVRE